MEVTLRCYSFPFNLLPFTFVFHFPADVRKPDSFESGFLVFGVGALLRSDNAVECLSAHSDGESHITNATLSYFVVFFYPSHATVVRLTQCN